MKIAAIDVGTNSIHVVIAAVDAAGRIRVVDRARERVRLGRNDMRRLDPQAMKAALEALRAFRILMSRHGAERYRAVATSAVREADNGGAFLRRVEREVGLRVRVIPGREEARLIHLGVSQVIDLAEEPTAIVDAGGGSVEVVLVEGGRPVSLESRKLGVERLRHAFFEDDPPSEEQAARAEAHVRESLEEVLARGRALGIGRLVVTSGTLLTLVTVAARMDGRDADAVQNLTVSGEQLRETCRRVLRMPREQRLRLEGMDAKRADVALAGASLATVVLDRLRPSRVVACTWALREGLLLHYVQRHRRTIEEVEQEPDVRRRGVLRLARHLGHDLGHGKQVARLALALFDHVSPALRLEGRDRQWLEWAALLHDVGHVIGHEDHHKHSQYLITRGDLLGFEPEDREIVGLIARYHRKGSPKTSDAAYRALSRGRRRSVRALSAVLRMADALDRSRFGVVRDLEVSRRGGGLTLTLHTGGQDSQLEVWEAERRSEPLEKIMGVRIAFRVAPPSAKRRARAS